MAGRAFFPGIQALRALAAILVVIEHAGSIEHHYTLMGFNYLIPHFSYGGFGVILFFAISGFVIALQRKKPLGSFVLHRLLRIYPVYWLATFLSFLMLGAVGLPVRVTAESLLLYPSSTYDPTSTIPYWTLIFEMTFYALAAVAIAIRLSDRSLTIVALFWIMAVNLIGHPPVTAAEYTFPGRWILLSPLVQVFPIGLICGINFKRLKRFGRWAYFVGAACSFFAGVFFAYNFTQQIFAMGLCCSCLIVGLADFDIRSNAMLRLGDASYGIYLLHFPPMYALSMIYPMPGDAAFFLVGTIVGIGFGLLDHRLYESLKKLVRQPVVDLALS